MRLGLVARRGCGAPVYFGVCRDWCDSLVFREDGSFGSTLGAGGRWRLARSGALRLTLGDGEVELDACGRGFRAPGLELEHSSGRTLSRRGLVFSSVGSQCLPVVTKHWLNHGDMRFDLVLAFYKDKHSDVYKSLRQIAQKNQAVAVHHRPGMKWPNFLHWAEAEGAGLKAVAERYDYIWVVDDDVRLATRDINRMFELLRVHPNIKFASPSFDGRSDGVWRYFDRHDPRFKLRYTDFVECTAPVLRSSMLLDPGFVRCLRAARTGCFLDFCFHPAAGGGREAVAVLDAVQCHHPPRGADTPSEMRQLKAWEDHKEDDALFMRAGIPRHWWWFRKPQIFSGLRVDGKLS